MMKKTRAARALSVTLLGTSVLMTLGACAGSAVQSAATPKTNPKEWVAVACQSCKSKSIEIHARRSVGNTGDAGNYTYARVRNLNPHPIALTLELTPNEPPLQDSFVPPERFRVTLHSSGEDHSESVVMMKTAGITSAAIHTVDRY